MKRRILAALMALALCLGLAGTAWADDNRDSYEVTGGKIYLIEGLDNCFYVYACDESVTAVDIPSVIVQQWSDGVHEFPVVGIEESAFEGCTNLTSVSIPANITSIEATAFRGCPNLREITVAAGNPNYVFSDGVLYNKDKTRLALILDYKAIGNYTVSDGVTTIGAGAFKGCTELTGITLPNGLTDIEKFAFEDCTGLTSITVPGSLARPGFRPFGDCTNLTSFYFEGDAFNYSLGESRSYSWLNLVSDSSDNITIYYPAGNDTWEHLGYSEEYLAKYGIVGFAEYTPGDSAVISPSTPSTLSAPADNRSAAPTASTVLVNGEQVAFDAYNIGGNNYFKLRDLAFVLSGTEKQFEVGWDNASKTIALTSGQSYTANGSEMAARGSGNQAAVLSTSKILVNGEEVALTAYNIGGNNYFKLRDLGQVFDFGVGWDNDTKTITIDTSTGYTE